MVADVYAGDDNQAWDPADGTGISSVLFLIEADPDADALCRVANVISLTNRLPTAAKLVTTLTGRVVITIRLRAVTAEKTDCLLRKLNQLTCVVRADVHDIARVCSVGELTVSE